MLPEISFCFSTPKVASPVYHSPINNSTAAIEVCNGAIIQSVSLSDKQISRYRKIEFKIDISANYKDPHDPAEIKVDLQLTRPDGSILLFPCFYESGPPQNARFIGRFSPRQLGSYSAVVLVEGPKNSAISEPYTFQSIQSAHDGFLHVNANSPYTLTFDSGKAFRGIGQNFAWEARIDLGDNQQYTYAYMFEKLAAQKANFVRTWMCPWNLPLEWKQTDFGRYTDDLNTYNTSAIERIDYMLAEAEKHGIYIMLTLDYHGALYREADTWGGNNYWPDHNYQVEQGGPASLPSEFFTHPEARKLYRNRLRYLVARWSYHPNIVAWELWNEIDNAQAEENISAEQIVNWHDEMATYFKSIDPYDRIVTTSISHRELPGLFALPSIDLSQSHLYASTLKIPATIEGFNNKYQKPYVVGEFAHNWTKPSLDDLTAYAKDHSLGLWMGLFSPTPILPMTWWWVEYDLGGLNPNLGTVAQYQALMLKDSSTNIQAYSIDLTSDISSRALEANGQYFVWVHNELSEEQDFNASLNNLEEGQWFITAYNTNNGYLDSLAQIKVNNGLLSWEVLNLKPSEHRAYIISQKGFYESSNPISDLPTLNTNELDISPNPVTDKVLINHKNKIAKLYIVDFRGKVVWTEEKVNQTWIKLDLSSLPRGSYVLKVEGINGEKSEAQLIKW